ncbi:hypothetical protein NQ318_022412 [Aromia moschata]|uniref:Uncharacterized protein n=1 Tax=Aromia moschata TaxID=1265417 RepID=A0AAV8Z534_9CUCU|nr:hypothetical protein NQ318_022412 [Aromia moschata]
MEVLTIAFSSNKMELLHILRTPNFLSDVEDMNICRYGHELRISILYYTDESQIRTKPDYRFLRQITLAGDEIWSSLLKMVVAVSGTLKSMCKVVVEDQDDLGGLQIVKDVI